MFINKSNLKLPKPCYVTEAIIGYKNSFIKFTGGTYNF